MDTMDTLVLQCNKMNKINNMENPMVRRNINFCCTASCLLWQMITFGYKQITFKYKNIKNTVAKFA